MLYRPVIAIIIPVHNRLKITMQSLPCISNSIDYYYKNANHPYKIQLIVVDDGSTDGTGDWIRWHYPEVVVLNGNGNLWWTGAVNMGIEYFQNRFENKFAVVLQNDDIIIEKEWLLNLLTCASHHENALIGCATSTLDNKDLIYYGGISVHSWLSRTKRINKGRKRADFRRGHVEESFDLYGRGLFVPMEVFLKTGLFNARRFKHRGDMDIPLRAKKMGYKLLVSYDSIVFQLPEYTYSLDTKNNLTISEALKLLTDFRSSTNLSLSFFYSLQATKNRLQFIVFFSFRTLFTMKNIISRCLKWKVI